MGFNRRKFLVLGGLASFGLAGLWGFLRGVVGQRSSSATSPSSTPVDGFPRHTIDAKNASQKPLLRFVAIADSGSGDLNQYAVANAMNRYHQQFPFPLVVLAGDNIYTNGEISKIGTVFEQPYQPLLEQGVKFHACLGNHDIRTDNGDPQIRYVDFNMQGRFYTFREKRFSFLFWIPTLMRTGKLN